MNRDTPLPTFRLQAGTTLTQAQPGPGQRVTLDSPALEVMTDLSRVRAATTPPDTSLHQAEQMMIYQGVRMLFVVSDMPELEGLITTTDIYGDRRMQVQDARGLRYDELRVSDVMTALSMLDAIDIAEMRTASVGNLIATLKRFGRNHLLVVEAGPAPGGPQVRGVISRAQIERQLGAVIDVTPVASSFSEIKRALV